MPAPAAAPDGPAALAQVSRGYLREQFAWQHYYWILTDTGIEYLRQYLHLPSTVEPLTLKARPTEAPPAARFGASRESSYRRPRMEGDGGRESYRSFSHREDRPPVGEAGFRPDFRGGYGRSAGDVFGGAPPGRGAPRA